MSAHLKRIFPEIDTCPLYYISTHGFYNMKKYNEGVPIETTVPENIVVIETSTIEEYCLFTNFLLILEPLFKNRERFLSYLGGLYPESDSPLTRKIILTALSQCQFYLPGARIANRIMEMSGGLYKYTNKYKPRIESERTGDYSKMGFYKYPAGSELEREEIFTERRKELITRAYGNVGSHGYAVNTSKIPFETYETMFNRINDNEPGTFKIIFFSSCGELVDTTPSSITEIQQIENIQIESIDLWKRKTRQDYNEMRLMYKDNKFTQEITNELGISDNSYVPKRPSEFSEKQQPNGPLTRIQAFRMERKGLPVNLTSIKGGSRRFVKKSKSKRKNRTRKFKSSP